MFEYTIRRLSESHFGSMTNGQILGLKLFFIACEHKIGPIFNWVLCYKFIISMKYADSEKIGSFISLLNL